jgi:hypothetical protein
MQFEDLTGKRFTRLVVTSRAESNKYGHTRWNCKCDCGNDIVAYASDLKRGGRPSCGCLKSEKIRDIRKLDLGQAALNYVFSQYKKSAKEREIVFALTMDCFKSFIDNKCHYCGAGPSLKAFGVNRMAQNNVNGNFIYTGIDRKNSDEGYHPENCVACCKTCNFAKNDMSYDYFINYLNRLVAFRSSIAIKETV